MTQPDNPRVLLIHGIWNHKSWLAPLAARMRGHGFEPTIFAYDSILKGPEAAMPVLLDTLQRLKPAHLVGHSLGGLLALETLAWAPDLPIERVVCLGTPLRGSLTARHMAAHPLLRHALGRSRGLLTRGFDVWSGRAQVGMIAGTAPRGLGRLVAPLRGQSDGTVLLTETQLPGLTAHCSVACGHTELAFADIAARRAVEFLRTGTFGENHRPSPQS